MSLEGKANMVHVYLYRDPENKKRNHTWQHEVGMKILSYVRSLPENEGLKYSNISHSGGYVALALADMPVGVDVELKREMSVRVFERAFSENERQLLYKGESQFTPIQLWTLKESYGKSKGVGIAYPLSEVEFTPASDRDDAWRIFACSDDGVCCYSHLTEDYVLSLCVQGMDEEKLEFQMLQNTAWM